MITSIEEQPVSLSFRKKEEENDDENEILSLKDLNDELMVENEQLRDKLEEQRHMISQFEEERMELRHDNDKRIDELAGMIQQ